MKNFFLYILVGALLIACSSEKSKGEDLKIDFEINANYGSEGKESKYVLKQEKEEFKIAVNHFDGGVSLKMKKKKRFLGKKKFNLLGILPNQEKIFNQFIQFQAKLKSANLIGFESNFKNVQFKDTAAKVFFQEGIEKQLIESNRNREGLIFEETKDSVKVLYMPKRAKEESTNNLSERFNSWKLNELTTACFFDIVKTKQVIKFWGEAKLNKEFTGVAYYLNPVSNLVEPLLYYTANPTNTTDILGADFSDKLNTTDSSTCFSKENFEKYFELKDGVYSLNEEVKEIAENIIIPAGLRIKISKKNLNLKEGAFILSFSPVNLNGLTLVSSDSTGRGFHVINVRGKSSVKNCTFNGLKNLSYENWNLPSAVTFYESPVDVFNSKFLNNDCEDGLNLFRSFPFVLDSCVFENTFSDAFDADFSDGTIKNTVFRNLGNDGIDVSGSNVNIQNCRFINVADKALSSGEASAMHVDNIVVDGASLAITAKDKSTIDIANSEIKNSEVVFCAFQKKKEFGPSQIVGKNVKFSEFKRDFLVEEKSSLIIDGEPIKKFEKDVKQILYGNEYGKATVK